MDSPDRVTSYDQDSTQIDLSTKIKLTSRKSCIDSSSVISGSTKRSSRKSSVRVGVVGMRGSGAKKRLSGKGENLSRSESSCSPRSRESSNTQKRKRVVREVIDLCSSDEEERPQESRSRSEENDFFSGKKRKKRTKSSTKRTSPLGPKKDKRPQEMSSFSSRGDSVALKRLKPVRSVASAGGMSTKKRKKSSKGEDRLEPKSNLKGVGDASPAKPYRRNIVTTNTTNEASQTLTKSLSSSGAPSRKTTAGYSPRENLRKSETSPRKITDVRTKTLSARELSQQRILQKLMRGKNGDSASASSSDETRRKASSKIGAPVSSGPKVRSKPRLRRPSVRSSSGSEGTVARPVLPKTAGKKASGHADVSLDSPLRLSRGRSDKKKFVVLLDLDHTLIHMTRRSVFPTESKTISEYVFDFNVDEVPYQKDLDSDVYALQKMCLGDEFKIAVRKGASILVKVLRDHPGVDVRVVTANVFGKEIVRRIASIDPEGATSGWIEFPTFVTPNPQKKIGIKTLALSGLPENAAIESQLIILDDQDEAWHDSLRGYVWKMKAFNILEPKSQAEVSTELTYIRCVLGDIKTKLDDPSTPKRKKYG